MSTDVHQEALERFDALFRRAGTLGLNVPEAFTLATADADGRPSARVVLLKSAGRDGFVFYTNCESRKSEELAANPLAALAFFWDPLMEQVRVEGRVEVVSEEEADAYWSTRHRDSQIGAWASRQSRDLDAWGTLEAEFAEHRARFDGAPVPRPPHWSGYRVAPSLIEFWVAGDARLNVRDCYRAVGGRWEHVLLYP